MKLYYAPGACSLAAHIALIESGSTFERIRVDLKSKRMQDGGDYFSINPNGYVPALEISPGDILTEGPAILQFIADRSQQGCLAPANGTRERYRLQAWLNFVISELQMGIVVWFKAASPDDAKALLEQRYSFVNTHLQTNPYLMGLHYSIADVYLFVTLGWLGQVGIDLAQWTNLSTFQTRIADRPAVQAAFKEESATV